MKARKSIKLISLFLLSICLSVVSCKKDNNTIDNTPTTDTNSSQDNSIAENMFADVFKVTDDALKNDSATGKQASGSILGQCATITVTPAWPIDTFPKTMIIDFDTGCTSTIDFRHRKGSIHIVLSGRYRDSGTIVTVTPVDYYVNSYKVEGIKTITNQGYNADSNLSFSVLVNNGKITTPSNETITWNSSRTNEWIEGENTTYLSHGINGICDDIYLITGSANGTNRKGNNYNVMITSALRKKICCRHIVSGILVITPAGLAARTINYGNGTCDGDITVTINGKDYDITLP